MPQLCGYVTPMHDVRDEVMIAQALHRISHALDFRISSLAGCAHSLQLQRDNFSMLHLHHLLLLLLLICSATPPTQLQCAPIESKSNQIKSISIYVCATTTFPVRTALEYVTRDKTSLTWWRIHVSWFSWVFRRKLHLSSLQS